MRLLAYLSALLWLTLPASSQTCEDSPLKGKTFSQLLDHYAPQVLHWHDNKTNEWAFLDFFMRIDFDGDWVTPGNRKNAQLRSLRGEAPTLQPAMYADVIAATRSHLYLLYYFYHAADRGSGFTKILSLLPLGWGEHEHDLEGGFLVVDRCNGKVIAASYLAHNSWDDRQTGAPGEEDGRLAWVVWIEGGKHGAHLTTKRQLKDPNTMVWGASGFADRSHLLRYLAGAGFQTAHVLHKSVFKEKSWDDFPATPAAILPLWPIFRRMYGQDAKTPVSGSQIYTNLVRSGDIVLRFQQASRLPVYRAMLGAEGNKAKFPWGQEPERFFDPALKLKHRSRDEGIDLTYVYNPYLQSVLEGTVVESPGDYSPVFPADRYPRIPRRPVN